MRRGWWFILLGFIGLTLHHMPPLLSPMQPECYESVRVTEEGAYFRKRDRWGRVRAWRLSLQEFERQAAGKGYED